MFAADSQGKGIAQPGVREDLDQDFGGEIGQGRELLLLELIELAYILRSVYCSFGRHGDVLT